VVAVTEYAAPACLILFPVIGGTLLTYLYEDTLPLGWRLSAGACCGLAAFGLVGFMLASWFGLTSVVILISLIAFASPICLMAMSRVRQMVVSDLTAVFVRARRAVKTPTIETAAGLTFCCFAMVLLWWVFDRAMFEQADGMYTGVMNNYGDLPFHLGVISRFAYGNNFPPEDPTYAGVRFAYPFLADFVAAMLMIVSPVRTALQVENFVLVVSFVVLLRRWAFEVTGDRRSAILTPFLALVSGNLLEHLTHDYTIMPGHEWRLGNLITTLLIPQRSILFGLPLAVTVFTLWRRASLRTESDGSESIANTRRMMGAGVITGLLPLVHAHTFVVVIVVGACVMLLFDRKRTSLWVSFFATALLLALPQIAWSTHGTGISASRFVQWKIGWEAEDQNLVLFWLKNAGLVIPLTAAALMWDGNRFRFNHDLLRFYVPFTACFFAPNVLRLSPWIWDNIKVLAYWQLASLPLVALLLSRLWDGSWWRRLATVMLFAALTLAGALDIWRVLSRASQAQVFSREAEVFAELVRQVTAPHSLILHAPIHNHPVFLTGRRSLMGYPGHVWSHGLDYSRRQADIQRMYAGESGAEALLAGYGIDYVVLGPPERRELRPNDRFFERYERAGEAGGFALYRISSGR
jgi:hypothetical protein